MSKGPFEPDEIVQDLRDMAADMRRSEKWAVDEASADDCHPNDRDRYEIEADQWAVAAREIERAAAAIEASPSFLRPLLERFPATPRVLEKGAA